MKNQTDNSKAIAVVGATEALAAFVADAQVPEFVRTAALKPFVDTIGVMVAGASSEVAPAMMQYLQNASTAGNSAVLGSNLRAAPEIAALANGTFAHALDFDDAIAVTPVHPSCSIAAALVAVANGISGRKLLAAYAIGVEVAVKLSTALGVEHFNHGWHGTGTLGIFGSVAAVGRARQLPAATIRTAFGLASSMSSGLLCNFGTMAKSLHSGWAARNAIIALDLAASGFSAAQDALEAKTGFFAVYGNAKSDIAGLAAALGNPYAIADPGMSLKRYACAYGAHRAIEGMLAVKQALGLTADNLESIRCVVAPGSLRVLTYHKPSDGLQGKFSLEYALCAGILDDAYSLSSFSDEAVQRPAAQALLARIVGVEEARCSAEDVGAADRGPSRRGFVEVHARRKDGATAVHRVDAVPGSPEQPLTWEDLRAKFLDCTREAHLPEARATQALEALLQFDQCDDAGAVLDMLQTG